MARDDSPASSTAPAAARRPQYAVKWDRNLKPKLAIMRQCTSVTDRPTDGLASWHKREMYMLHLALKLFIVAEVKSNFKDHYGDAVIKYVWLGLPK